MAVEGPVLVIAGAGTGKTRTLVYRVARLIESGVSPEAVLLLTFTRRAAAEMLRRAGALLDGRCDRVIGGTFHSFANAILRRHGKPVGVDPAFTILDRQDSEDVIHFLRGAAGLSSREKRFPRKNTLAALYSKSVNKSISVEEILLEEYNHFADHLDDVVRLHGEYARYKQEKRLLDYDDLLLKLRDLLQADEPTRRTLWEAHRNIMVDEYQDTNLLQAEIVRLLAFTHDNVMVVGDDSQSIYSFRGARFKNIIDFPSQFPNTRIFTLEENYRSTQPILELTNTIIRHAAEKYSKTLFTSRAEGASPALVQSVDEVGQSKFVCQKILELREEGIPLEEIAVLFRSSHHSFDLEMELARHDIPFIKRGGFKFMEAAHVKDVLAFLRALANPRDAVSWNRVLLLVEGVGPRKSHEYTERIGSDGVPSEALRTITESHRAPKGMKPVAVLYSEMDPDRETPAELVHRILEIYLPILRQRYDDHPKRARDLEHLYAIAERYGRLEEFLSDMALEPPNESVAEIEPPDREDERLVLSTIHSAKGLEWRAVFIIWALDGKFPSVHSFIAEDDLEEERRLLYVAATRAKDHLFITYPINIFGRDTGTVLSKPSRFVEEIPRDLLDCWTVVEEGVDEDSRGDRTDDLPPTEMAWGESF